MTHPACSGISSLSKVLVHVSRIESGCNIRVLREMSTKNIGAVEERHNSVGFDVDLVAGVGRNQVQAGEVKAEFAGLL
jgi:hypothetical protein